jgi:hypothetical protein
MRPVIAPSTALERLLARDGRDRGRSMFGIGVGIASRVHHIAAPSIAQPR